MKWPWQKAPENRGTLTFLRGGRVILGVPHGSTERMTYEAVQALQKRIAENPGGLLVLPFPVDVVDKR